MAFIVLLVCLPFIVEATRLPQNWKSRIHPEMLQKASDTSYSPKFFQGDISGIDVKASVQTKKRLENQMALEMDARWSQGVIPYTINQEFTDGEIQDIETAMKLLSSQTRKCIKFVQRSNERDYLVLRRTLYECSSAVGRQGRKQSVQLAPGCMEIGAIQHELMHSIGLHHEMARPDRDNYVSIIYENIKEEYKSNFDIQVQSITIKIPYDIESVMHYKFDEFTKYPGNPGAPTIVPKKGSPRIGQRDLMTSQDAAKIMLLYGCEQEDSSKAPTKSCAAGNFQCISGKCILESKTCNGRNNCPGGDDEEDCPVKCQIGQFQCSDNQCVEDWLVCDGGNDCSNGADEDQRKCRTSTQTSVSTTNTMIEQQVACGGDNQQAGCSQQEDTATVTTRLSTRKSKKSTDPASTLTKPFTRRDPVREAEKTVATTRMSKWKPTPTSRPAGTVTKSNLERVPFSDGKRCPSFENGRQCGCWIGLCWAYVKSGSVGGDPWCYTQVEGFPKGRQKWAKCNSDRDCKWTQTCGSDVVSTGIEDLKPDTDAFACPTYMDGARCGCWKEKCWASVGDEESNKGRNEKGQWCYTQKLGVARGKGEFATCTSHRHCSWMMTCGDDEQFQGPQRE